MDQHHMSLEHIGLNFSKLGRMQRSGIDSVKYHTWPSTPYGKVTKTQQNATYRRAKKTALSQQVTIILQDTDKTIWQIQIQIKKKIHRAVEIGGGGTGGGGGVPRPPNNLHKYAPPPKKKKKKKKIKFFYKGLSF